MLADNDVRPSRPSQRVPNGPGLPQDNDTYEDEVGVKRALRFASKFRPPKRVMHLAGWAVAGQLVPLAAAPVLARIYSPEDFGVLAVVVATTSVLLVLASGRLEIGITTAPTSAEGTLIARTGRFLVMGVSLTLAIAVAILAMLDISILGMSPPVLALLAPATLIGGWLAVDRGLLIRVEDYNRIGLRSLLGPTGQVVQQFAWVLRAAGQFGLVAGWALGNVLAILVPKRIGRVGIAGPREGLKGIYHWRQFPITLVPAGLLNQVAQYLPVFVLGALFGDAILGQYSLVVRILGVPAGLMAFAAGQFFFGTVSRVHREKSGDVTALLRRAVLGLLLFGGLPVLCLSLTSSLWVPVVFGDQWREAGTFGMLMAPALAAQITVVPVGNMLVSLGQNASQLRWDVYRVVFLVISAVALSLLESPPVVAVGAISFVLSITYLELLLRVFRAARTASRDTTNDVKFE